MWKVSQRTAEVRWGRGESCWSQQSYKARPNLQDREPPSMMPAHRPEVGVGPISTG